MAEQRSIAEARAYPEWLRQREAEALRQRHRALEQPHVSDRPRVGLALSGGGIRSATFSLGLVQALARSGVLPKIDYLSTVSGGGYIGAFLGALYVRSETAAEVKEALTRFPESRPLEWLRSNGRFLAPNGAGANWLAGAVLLRNWISLLFVVAPVAFFFSFLGVLARVALHEPWAQPLLDGFAAFQVGELGISPLVVVPAIVALYWMLPAGVAYWMVNAGHVKSSTRSVSAVACAVALLLPLGLAHRLQPEGSHLFSLVLGIVAIAAVAFLAAGLLRWRSQRSDLARSEKARFDPFGPDSDSIARNKLSEWLKGGFMVVVFTAVITLLDSLAYVFRSTSALWSTASLHKLIGLATAAGTLVLGTHRLLAQFGSRTEKKGNGSGVPVQLLIACAAILLILLGAIVVSTTTYWITVRTPRAEPNLDIAVLGLAASFFAMVLLGRFVVFVNQSSLGPIYNARLTRAYVGASNPNRWKPEANLKGRESPTEPIVGDQLAWDKYKPYQKGGPIHLINVTVNETVDARVQLHQPDRKGMIMAVGPEGVSLGVRHHAAWDGKAPAPDPELFHVFPTGKELTNAEQPPLGHWVAISGAAVATGLGQLSRWGASLLCGVFNIRLGYWWASNTKAKGRPHQAQAVSLSGSLMGLLGYLFPVYRLLAAEFLDRFPGTAIESWYLTDGGHLENTGCYELIRRRVPFILCIDNGADPEAECSDLANLVRLARVDFGAEIEFLDREQLNAMLDPEVAGYFGSVQDLKREPPSPPAYAGLARIRYTEGGSPSWLVLVKPRVLGTEALDITAYGLSHPSFPQQSTGDQSFDDAQWEAYRRLGEHIGARLFDTKAERSDKHWSPKWLDQEAFELLNRQLSPDSAVRRVAPGEAAAVETVAEMIGRFTVLRK